MNAQTQHLTMVETNFEAASNSGCFNSGAACVWYDISVIPSTWSNCNRKMRNCTPFDTPLLPSFPLKSGAAGAEPVGLQLGEFVAAAGVAQRNRQLVADHLAVATGQDGRTPDQARPLLLATAGGDAVALWRQVTIIGECLLGRLVENIGQIEEEKAIFCRCARETRLGTCYTSCRYGPVSRVCCLPSPTWTDHCQP